MKRDRVAELKGDLPTYCFSTGAELDQEAAKYDVKRAPGQSDHALRLEIDAVLLCERIGINAISHVLDVKRR